MPMPADPPAKQFTAPPGVVYGELLQAAPLGPPVFDLPLGFYSMCAFCGVTPVAEACAECPRLSVARARAKPPEPRRRWRLFPRRNLCRE